MKGGIAKPEVNNGKKLTLPARTMSPIEAFRALRQGQPIDQIGQLYHVSGHIDKDFFMMDKTEKLHKLQELRELRDHYKTDVEYWQGVYQEALAASNNNQTNANGSSAQKLTPENGGAVSQ